MRARRSVQYAPLTSLLDVMFILVFASLIHSAALEKKHSLAATEKPAVVPAPVTKPATTPGRRSRSTRRCRRRAMPRSCAARRWPSCSPGSRGEARSSRASGATACCARSTG